MPYAPGVTDRSGEILASGINQGVSSITDQIMRAGQETKKLKALRAMAVDGLGMDPDAVDKMDADTISGKLEGAALQRSQKHQDLEMENEKLKHIMLTGQIATAKAAADSQAGFNRDLATYEQPNGVSSAVDLATGPGDFTPGAMMRTNTAPTVGRVATPDVQLMMARKNNLPVRDQYELANAAQLMRKAMPTAGESLANEFTNIPGTESVMASRGKQAFVVPKASDMRVRPMTNDTGEVLGYEHFDGKKWEPLPPPKQTDPSAAIRSQTQATRAFRRDTLDHLNSVNAVKGQLRQVQSDPKFADLYGSSDDLQAQLKQLNDMAPKHEDYFGPDTAKPTKAAAAAAAKAPPANAQALLDEANAAIAKGAPRDKVLARLKDQGIEVK